MTDAYVPKHAALTTTNVGTPSGHSFSTGDAPEIRILFATPCYGGQVTERYLQSMIPVMLELQRQGIQASLYTSAGESLITRARNDAVDKFLNHPDNFTHLFFIDADIGFTYEQVERLIHTDYDVTVGTYPLKTVDWDRLLGKTWDSRVEMISNTLEVVTNQVGDPGEDGFAETLDAGTGFMCIRRNVLETMIEAMPETRYIKDDFGDARDGETYALFDTIIENERYLSEDYAFCRRWQALGGKIHVDMHAALLLHQGIYVYGKA